jgi:histidinol-phosphate aminotransferase
MMAAVESTLANIHRYPDREALVLRGKLATYLGHGLSANQIWAANGSNEVMTEILQCFAGPGRTLLTFPPTYSMYPEYARNTHTQFVTTPRREDFQIDLDQVAQAISLYHPDVIVIANPNNPTGTLTTLEDIEAILNLSEAIVIVDEAYQEFSSAPSALDLLDHYGNLIVARTMSKAFAFAGGRLGYAAAATTIIDALRVVRLPYHLSALTQAVAGAALDHAEAMLAQVDHLSLLREATIEQLRALGLTVIDSRANFFLFGPFADRHATWQALVDRGVLVRETGPESYLRVSVGTDQEMETFIYALAAVLAPDPAASPNSQRSAA